jgi:hypothetical protein
MSKVNPFILLFSILTLYCPPAVAQIAYEPTWSPPDLMAINNIKFNPVVNGIIDKGQSERAASALPTTQTVAPTYTPSRAVRQKNLAKFVAKTRGIDPVGAERMEQLFANGDIVGQIDAIMQTKGLTASNAADAYAIWWVAAWQAANADTREIDGGTYKSVSAQAARGLSSSPEFANASDAQKQEMAEALLIQAAMIDSHKDVYAGDQAMMAKLGDAVRQGAEKSGLDLDKMTLTEDGFAEVKGRKTGAAGSTDKATNPELRELR